jgi:hypothetical protein
VSQPRMDQEAVRTVMRQAAAARQRVTKRCEVCGGEMHDVLKKRRYCSAACSSKAARRRKAGIAKGEWAKPHGHWEWVRREQGPISPRNEPPKPLAETGDRWGPWVFNREKLELRYPEPMHAIHPDIWREWRYSVSLKGCTSSAPVLDWIAQVSHKGWCSPEDLGHLVRALDALLGLQQHVCSMELDHQVDPTQLITGIREGSQLVPADPNHSN